MYYVALVLATVVVGGFFGVIMPWWAGLIAGAVTAFIWYACVPDEEY